MADLRFMFSPEDMNTTIRTLKEIVQGINQLRETPEELKAIFTQNTKALITVLDFMHRSGEYTNVTIDGPVI